MSIAEGRRASKSADSGLKRPLVHVDRRLLAELTEIVPQSPGGILLPDTVKAWKVYEVVAVGPGRVRSAAEGGGRYPMEYKPGEIVMVGPTTMGEFPWLNQRCFIVHDNDVVARVDKDTVEELKKSNTTKLN